MSKQQNEEVVENQPQEVVESTENERSEAAATEPSTTEAQFSAREYRNLRRKTVNSKISISEKAQISTTFANGCSGKRKNR